MKNKALYSVIFFTLFFLFTAIAGKSYIDKKNDFFSCKGNLIAHRGDQSLELTSSYLFKNGLGEIDSVGKIYRKDATDVIISRKMLFSYTKEENDYFLVSKQNFSSNDNISLLKHITPDFFYYPNRGFGIKILPQGNNTFIFIYEGLPIFACYAE